MDCGTVPYGPACGCADRADGLGTGCISCEEDLSAIAAGRLADDGGLSAWPEASTAEANLIELWFLLPEQEKQELGVLFSRMVVKLFRVLSNEEVDA